MSYVPPYRRRPNLCGNAPTIQKITKQEHREQFPSLRDTQGNAVQVKPIKPVVDWTKITYDVDELHATPETPEDGWVNLSVYESTPDTAMTNADLERCAEALELNWRRYYTERDLRVPLWISDNPYNKYEDFDRTIPYSEDYQTDTDTEESSIYDEDEYISDNSM